MTSQPQDFKKKVPSTDSLLAPSSAKAWRAGRTITVKLPSDNVCVMKRVPLETFLKQGFFPDSLTPLISEMISDNKKSSTVDKEKAQAKLNDAMENVESIQEMLEMFNEVAVKTIVEPTVQLPPNDDFDRDDDVLYADEIDLEDKIFIFQVCVGGTTDVERFRKETRDNLGSLPTVSEDRNQSEQFPTNK